MGGCVLQLQRPCGFVCASGDFELQKQLVSSACPIIMPRRVGGGGAAPGFVREVTLSQYSREMLHMQSMPNFVADGLYLLCPFLRSVHPLSLPLFSEECQFSSAVCFCTFGPSLRLPILNGRSREERAGGWREWTDRPRGLGVFRPTTAAAGRCRPMVPRQPWPRGVQPV